MEIVWVAFFFIPFFSFFLWKDTNFDTKTTIKHLWNSIKFILQKCMKFVWPAFFHRLSVWNCMRSTRVHIIPLGLNLFFHIYVRPLHCLFISLVLVFLSFFPLLFESSGFIRVVTQYDCILLTFDLLNTEYGIVMSVLICRWDQIQVFEFHLVVFFSQFYRLDEFQANFEFWRLCIESHFADHIF